MKNFYSFISLLALLLINSWSVYSIPAKSTPFIIRQPDGTELTVKLHGDESFHFYTSEDNYLLVPDKQGIYCYADEQSGEIKPSAYKAKNVTDRTETERRFLVSLDRAEILRSLQKTSELKPARLKSTRQRINSSYPTTGEQKALIILVEFQDRKFSVDNPTVSFDNMINQKGYSGNGGTGSARDYFIENSAGKYLPDFDVFGPVTLANNMSYYGGNTGGGIDQRPHEMVTEACSQLDNIINFADYDRDQNGVVDNVYVFYAGYGEADGGPANSVWPHAWGVYNGAGITLILDGVRVDSYACSNELADGQGTRMNGIGAFCHEFTHVLGFPDLYATNSAASFTPGEWSLMDHGSYNNEGRTPPYMSAYERYFLGWLEPITASAADTAFVLPDISANKAYLIKTATTNEYFLFENRQQHNWDTYLPGHGMLVWHIDYDPKVWEKNAVNNIPIHQYVDIEEADGTQTYDSRGGDAFPGTEHRTSITDITKPNLISWSGAKRTLSILDITETDNLITFKVFDPRVHLDPPKAKPATDITFSSFRANWEKIKEATGYQLDVYVKENDDINYLPEYQRKDVGDVSSFTIEGLEANTNYCYVVRGKFDAQTGISSEEILVQTLIPTFGDLVPKATEATLIAGHSFTANWEKINDARDYLVYVYKTAGKEDIFFVNDFIGGIKMPEGWKTTCTSTYSASGYYGKESPALKFDKPNYYLESPVAENNIASLSFWCKGANVDPANALIISGYNGNEWNDILSVSPIENSAKEYSLNSQDLGGKYKCIRFTYQKINNGNVALDDIRIISIGLKKELLAPYNGKSAGNTQSAVIEGLEPETGYLYTVKAYDGNTYSKMSNEMAVSTVKEESGIGCAELDISVSVSGNVLNIENLTFKQQKMEIYTLLGKLLVAQALSEGNTDIRLPAKQIYIVKIGNSVFKVVL